MIIIIIFCILSACTFATDEQRVNTPRSRSSRSSGSASRDRNPTHQEQHTPAYQPRADTPRIGHALFRRSPASTSRDLNQSYSEQYAVESLPENAAEASTSRGRRRRSGRSNASTSRDPNPTNLEQYALGSIAEDAPDHESLPYTPRILQPLLPSRPSTSTSWEPSLTYPAQLAEIDTPKICVDWVRFYGFEDDFSVNFHKAQEYRNDYDIHFWAARFMYGFFHTQFYFIFDTYKPEIFCNKHTYVHAFYDFISLKDAEFTCEGWIDFYGYDHKLDFENNFNWIIYRDRSMDPYISIWAKTYFDYITNKGETSPITSTQFCNRVGIQTVDLPEVFPFMKLDGSNMSCINYIDFYRFNYSWNGEEIVSDVRKAENRMPNYTFKIVNLTYMSCLRWITEYQYFDNLDWNMNKIWNRVQEFDIYLPLWTRNYIEDVTEKISLKKTEYIMSPKRFCQYSGKPAKLLLNFDGKDHPESQDQAQD